MGHPLVNSAPTANWALLLYRVSVGSRYRMLASATASGFRTERSRVQAWMTRGSDPTVRCYSCRNPPFIDVKNSQATNRSARMILLRSPKIAHPAAVSQIAAGSGVELGGTVEANIAPPDASTPTTLPLPAPLL